LGSGSRPVDAEADLAAYLRHRRFAVPSAGPPQAVYLKSNGRYTMKAPFYNYEASRRHFEAAAAVAPRDWEIWANLATLSFLEGDVQAGERELRQAIAVGPDPIDLDAHYRWKVPYLRASLERLDLELEDFYAEPQAR
jgi:tetratricopeptide (TPR) repeat protein